MIVDFLHPLVRDLHWVMNSPSLLAASPQVVSDGYCRSVVSKYHDWLKDLDVKPEPLIAWIDRSQFSRLGYYFEHLVAYWLYQCIAPNHVHSHVRVYKGKRVLGEFDFLFQSPGNETKRHWETAVKFYLQYQDSDGNYHWYGPDARDTLDRKLSRLKEHQLKLAEFAESRALLIEKGFSDIQSQAFVKGYLFYPSDSNWSEQATIHEEASPGHLKGWWTRCDLFNIPLSRPDLRYVLLPRLQWLAPKLIPESKMLQALDQPFLDLGQLSDKLTGYFKRFRRPVLVAVMEWADAGYWHEISRGFVVSRSWPEFDE